MDVANGLYRAGVVSACVLDVTNIASGHQARLVTNQTEAYMHPHVHYWQTYVTACLLTFFAQIQQQLIFGRHNLLSCQIRPLQIMDSLPLSARKIQVKFIV